MIRSLHRSAALALALGVCLTACGDDDGPAEYQTAYTSHEPLQVTGHPSTGSLGTVQQIVWHLADEDAEALAALHTEGGDAGAEARAWIKAYGADAQGKVTADFLDEGSVRQDVVLHFAESRRTQELTVRIGDDDTWGVVLDDPHPTPEPR
ncbi:hypothetical protein [Streptomyces coerulescens]|uniref:Lipoprotein n=1 Tax=Streptomyces coerulescens TaxID=29304 RepID=A0ABW0CNU2_STRCD